jgi:hypothetical protein
MEVTNDQHNNLMELSTLTHILMNQRSQTLMVKLCGQELTFILA